MILEVAKDVIYLKIRERVDEFIYNSKDYCY